MEFDTKVLSTGWAQLSTAGDWCNSQLDTWSFLLQAAMHSNVQFVVDMLWNIEAVNN